VNVVIIIVSSQSYFALRFSQISAGESNVEQIQNTLCPCWREHPPHPHIQVLTRCLGFRSPETGSAARKWDWLETCIFQ